MLPTSGTYNFQSVQVELLIREAFERIGITGEFLDVLKIESAIRSINLILLEWMGKTVNLWTLRNDFLALIPAQGQYFLSDEVLDMVQVNLRTSSRQIYTLVPDGLAIAQTNTGATYDNGGGGVAANAFDDSITTGCIQNVVNGNISYEFGTFDPAGPNQLINTNIITFVGIQSNVTNDYTIIVEQCPAASDISVAQSWVPLITIPKQTYIEGITSWFDVPIPVDAKAYRIREIGGETLNIRQIYFNNNVFDFNISNVSRYEYGTYPNKNIQSRPNVYYLDRQLQPVLYIWPTPAPQYNCLAYSYKKMMQDVTLLTDTIEIPAKMYPALIWGLSYFLALKFNPQMTDMMEAKYERSFAEATKEDTEDISISIRGS
jgi:hypothetical protein